MKPASPLIRSFSVISHIDHGKSTLSDRLLQKTGTIAPREMQDQVLDSMDLERERGITIKAQAVQMLYRARDGQTYKLNLIDTPGHVDFSYEVSRALAACEGALLLVDASQGIEAQTLANAHLAILGDLTLIPIINKIDLDSARPEEVALDVEEVLGLPAAEAVYTSARMDIGTEDVLEAIVARIPPPQGDEDAPLKALVFDSKYDAYRGVIVYVRLVDGRVRPGQKVRMMAGTRELEVDEVGVFRPKLTPTEELAAGDVGYVIASIKDVAEARVGDTMTDAARPAAQPLPGYREAKPVVFAGLFPTDSEQFIPLREALERLRLNDASLHFEPESSVALGFGFRCGFLGLLHMDVVQERLEREYDLSLIATAPTVEYRVTLTTGQVEMVDNPAQWPDPSRIRTVEEPMARLTLVLPDEYVGAVMQLCQDRRATFRTMEHQGGRVVMSYDMPLGEMIHDFYDQLKSRTKGYASLDYEIVGYRPAELVKMDVLVAGEPVDALSVIVHRDKAGALGRRLTEKLKELLPRQMFAVPLQAAIGGKVVARETLSAMRKDVIAKCYGGDITRKRKLLEKQREGKKRMKRVGNVEIPQEAFMAVLSID